MFGFGGKKEEKIKVLEEENARIGDELKNLHIRLEGNEALLQEKEKTILQAQTTLRINQEELRRINDELKSTSSALAQKTQENKHLEKRLEEVEKKLESTDYELKISKEELQKNNKEIIELENKNKTLQEKCLQFGNEMRESQSKQEKSIEDFRIEKEKLQNELKDVTKVLQETQLQIKTLEGDRQSLVNEKYNLQKEISAVRESCERVQKSLNTNVDNLSREQEKKNEIEKSYIQAKEELKKMREVVDKQEVGMKEKDALLSNMKKELQTSLRKLQNKDIHISELKKGHQDLKNELKNTSEELHALRKEYSKVKDQVEKEMKDKMFSLLDREISETEPIEPIEDIESVKITPETLRAYLKHPIIGQKFNWVKQEIKGLMILREDREIEERAIAFFRVAGITKTLDLSQLFEDKKALDFLRRYIEHKGVDMMYQQVAILSILAYSKTNWKQREELEEKNLSQRGMMEIFDIINQETQEEKNAQHR